MKMCDRCGEREATSRTAKYCLVCRKERQVENGVVQGRANHAAGKGEIYVEPGRYGTG